MTSHTYSQIQPDAPRPSLTPLEALTHRATDSHSFWDEYAGWLLGVPTGFVAAMHSNYLTSRPLFANIPKYIFLMGAMGALGKFGLDAKAYRQAEEEAIAREYVEKHPDDFPPFDRKQYKEIFEEWIPIR